MSTLRHVKKALMISALLLLLTLSLGGGVASKSNDQAATYENLRLFTEVLSIIQSQYVDEVPPKDLVYSAIKGTLRGLDAHSSFLDPDMYREMGVETTGQFGGLGIEITLKDDILTVVTPIEGTPAFRAGILPGDRIVKIEGMSTKDMQLSDAVKRMRGKPGSKIVISIIREGLNEPKDYSITRELIQVQSVKSGELEPGIEYIRLRQFQEKTGQDVDTALEKYNKGKKIQGLVLDLRNNPWCTRKAASATRTCASRPAASAPGAISPSSFSSTRAAPPPPRSWRARSRTGGAPSCWGRRASARAPSRPSSPSPTARACG